MYISIDKIESSFSAEKFTVFWNEDKVLFFSAP